MVLFKSYVTRRSYHGRRLCVGERSSGAVSNHYGKPLRVSRLTVKRQSPKQLEHTEESNSGDSLDASQDMVEKITLCLFIF